jgi:hypothetical protein
MDKKKIKINYHYRLLAISQYLRRDSFYKNSSNIIFYFTIQIQEYTLDFIPVINETYFDNYK